MLLEVAHLSAKNEGSKSVLFEVSLERLTLNTFCGAWPQDFIDALSIRRYGIEPRLSAGPILHDHGDSR
jgi:hypothetical protein